MPLTVLYFAIHTTMILYYAPDCIVFCSPYHSNIILCPWLYCILQSIPQWYYTMPLTVLYFAVHTTVILYYAPDCAVSCSPYHSDIILCPWLYCILQSILQWYYTMSLTVLYFAVHTTVILYYAPDCIVFCSPYHSDIILCPWLCCILQSIPQWYYTMPLTVLYLAVHTTVILYYALDCIVFCNSYHSGIILCPRLYCILQSIPQWYYTMPLTVLYFAVYITVILYYAPDCIVFCSPYHSDIILCPWLYCILQSIPQWYYNMSLTVLYIAIHTTVILYYAPDCTVFFLSIPQWYYTMPLTVLYFAVHTTVILYYVPDCIVFCSSYHSDIILCPWLYRNLQSIPQWYYTMFPTVL